MKKIGFIGSGNMASAIMGGIIKNKVFLPEEIIASDLSEDARKRAQDNLHITVTDSNLQVVKEAEVLVFAVKPQFYQSVIEQVREEITSEQQIITIAPGGTLKKLEEASQKPLKIVRTMPNTPALVGEGITERVVCSNCNSEKGSFMKPPFCNQCGAKMKGGEV